uniref:Uncharacterized protein n=1 Tax=Anguilla anguilla TaxID=7936 RepID=A0A0E9SB37_ANGAN
MTLKADSSRTPAFKQWSTLE